jgi:hypothetical protein
MSAPSMVFTAHYAASWLGVDIDVVEVLAQEMSPEDGCLNVIESLDDDAVSTTAFTRRGLDHLDELLDQRRSDFIQES